MTYAIVLGLAAVAALILWAAMAVSARISDDLEAQDAEENEYWP